MKHAKREAWRCFASAALLPPVREAAAAGAAGAAAAEALHRLVEQAVDVARDCHPAPADDGHGGVSMLGCATLRRRRRELQSWGPEAPRRPLRRAIERRRLTQWRRRCCTARAASRWRPRRTGVVQPYTWTKVEDCCIVHGGSASAVGSAASVDDRGAGPAVGERVVSGATHLIVSLSGSLPFSLSLSLQATLPLSGSAVYAVASSSPLAGGGLSVEG